jgi:hypothetical protein
MQERPHHRKPDPGSLRLPLSANRARPAFLAARSAAEIIEARWLTAHAHAISLKAHSGPRVTASGIIRLAVYRSTSGSAAQGTRSR